MAFENLDPNRKYLNPEMETMPIEELRQALADQWSETVSLVGSLSDEAGEKPMPEHPWFGPLNGKEWIAFQLLHAMDHIQQIAESGPRLQSEGD